MGNLCTFQIASCYFLSNFQIRDLLHQKTCFGCRNRWEFLQDSREDNSEIHSHWWTEDGRPTCGIEHGSGLVRWPSRCSFYPIRTWQFDFLGVALTFWFLPVYVLVWLRGGTWYNIFWLLSDLRNFSKLSLLFYLWFLYFINSRTLLSYN